MNVTTPNAERDAEADTFVETALKLSGKSEEETRTTGALDRADEQVEKLFVTKDNPPSEATQRVMLNSLEVVRDRCRQKTLFDAQGKVSRETLDALSGAGYWGLLVDSEYSGQAASFQAFAKFL